MSSVCFVTKIHKCNWGEGGISAGPRLPVLSGHGSRACSEYFRVTPVDVDVPGV